MNRTMLRLFGLVVCGVLATTAFAGGPQNVYDYENRVPYVWVPQNWPGGAVPVYTDLGNLGILSNARANQLTEAGWAQWTNVPTSSFAAAVAGDFSSLGLGDITDGSVTDVIGAFNGGGIHVIYDNDGNIMRNFFGVTPTSVLGISNLDFVAADGPEILEAWTVLSGPAVRSNDPNGDAFFGVFTHEFGHALNLAHSQANGATNTNADQPQARDCAAPWTGKPALSQHETMYPSISVTPTGSGAGMGTVDRLDDIAAISDLYPAPGWPQAFGTIRGKILTNDGKEITGVNVIARNVADPFNDVISYLSGQLSKGFAGPDGTFVLRGLTPGASYVIYVDNLISGAFAVPRLLALPGPEEYYNGVMESGNGETDDRCAYTPVAAAAGVETTANISFNKVKGAPTIQFIEAAGIIPTDITPDGSVVVGAIGSSSVFRWSEADGFQNVGGFPSGQPAISDDGSRIAANVKDEIGSTWFGLYENGGWSFLEPVSGVTPCGSGATVTWGSVYDISGDGSTIVGLAYTNGCATGGVRAFKWTEAGGTELLPKYDSPTRAGRANAVNYDGSVIVGWDDASTGNRRGTYWIGGVPQLIQPDPSLPFAGEALDVTRDGRFIVGLNHSRNSWRFSLSGGLEDLGNLAGGRSSGAGSTGDDGAIVTGWTDTFTTRLPAIWTAELGWSNFVQFMNSQGTYAQDIVFLNATASSADGKTITGFGNSIFGQVGWILKAPKAVVCHVSPGHPTDKSHTLDVSFPGGLGDHLAHGDTLGLCQHGGM